MGSVLISTKGRIVLPVAVRKALGHEPGMRVTVKLAGKHVRITPVPAQNTASVQAIRALLKYDGPTVPLSAMRVTGYKCRQY